MEIIIRSFRVQVNPKPYKPQNPPTRKSADGRKQAYPTPDGKLRVESLQLDTLPSIKNPGSGLRCDFEFRRFRA